MTTVWPVMVSVRHMATTMSAQSSLSAAFFRSDPDAERSICSGRRLAVARVPSSSPGATQLTSVSGANATAMQRVRWMRPAFDTAYAMDGAHWPEPGHRRDVDDAAPPVRLHDGCHRLDEAHWPRQIDSHDLVPHLEGKIVEIREGNRLVVSGIVDEDIQTAEAYGHVADQSLHGRPIGYIAGERRGVDLMARSQLPGHGLRLVAALCIDDGDMRPFFRQRVTNALPEPAVAARHDGDRALKVHERPPPCRCPFTADGLVELVEDRPCREQVLGGAESLLHRQASRSPSACPSAQGQQGQQQGDPFGDLRQSQQALRDRLNKPLDDLKNRGMAPNQQGKPGQEGQGQGDINDLGRAGEAMSEAESSLGEGNADSAVDSQGCALDALRKGAQGLAQSMQQQMGQGLGPGRSGRLGQPRAQQDTDPLGRPLRGREYGDDYTVKVPGEIDVQRARRIIEELRRRFGDVLRPQEELDYIERLLKDY